MPTRDKKIKGSTHKSGRNLHMGKGVLRAGHHNIVNLAHWISLNV